MLSITTRGESVYKCTVCNRKLRVPTNKKGMDVLHNCTITNGCKGKLLLVRLQSDILRTPTTTPSEVDVRDWFQHNVLHTHTQTIPSNKWNITHNLSGHPIAHLYLNKVVDGVERLVPVERPIITVVDINNITISFDVAESGQVQLIALSSVENTVTSDATVQPLVTQLTNDAGVLSLASLSTHPILSVSLTFVINNQPIVVKYTNIDSTAAIISPWVGASKVFIDRQLYTVRSLNILHHPDAAAVFLSGQIPPTGGIVYVSAIDGAVPKPKELFALLSAAPHTPNDKIYDEVVDISLASTEPSGLMYSYGKISANQKQVRQVYPYITVV